MDQLPLSLDAPPPEAPMPRPKSPTLTAYAEDWLAAYGKPPYYSEHAASVRAYNLRHYVLPTLGERPLDAITPNDLQRLQEDRPLRSGGRNRVVRRGVGARRAEPVRSLRRRQVRAYFCLPIRAFDLSGWSRAHG